jgi:hypothetical protein
MVKWIKNENNQFFLFVLQTYCMSTISTYLNEHSKISNSSSKFGSFSINSSELNGDLQCSRMVIYN